MTCLSFETLVDYWAAELPAAEQDAVEEHLFSCASCTDRSGRLAALQRGVRSIIPPVITAARLERLAQAGTRIRTTEVPPGATVSVVFARDVDLLIHRLRVDLPGVTRVDCEIAGVDGTSIGLAEGVPVERGEVLIACQRHFSALGPPDIVFRLRAAGQPDRVYTVVHRWE
jgi:hypothetical protein